MPQKRNPLTLEKFCLNKVCKLMEKYWYAPFEEQFGNTSRLLHVIGPFDHISSELIQRVIHVLTEIKIFHPKYLQLLLSNHLHNLDLSEVNSYMRQSSIAETIGIRCNNLTRLCLKNCSGFSNKSLVSMVTNLTKLQHLDLASTKSDNQVLAAIARHCDDLVTLNISCTQIQCIQPLLSREPSMAEGHYPCPKLRYVDFYRLMLPHQQVVDFLKARGDTLAEFIFDGMIDICDALANECIGDGSEDESFSADFKSLKIRTLNCDLSYYDIDTLPSLYTTMLACPLVTTVMLTNVCHRNCLLPLKNLVNLTRLSVVLHEVCRNDGDDLDHYVDGVKPVLENQRDKIQSLSLHGFPAVDIQSIATLCPNIKRLDLFSTNLSRLVESTSKDMHPFGKLEEFLYRPAEDDDIESDDSASPLLFLLGNAHALRNVNIQMCSQLDDAIILQANEEHSFRNLEILDLSECQTITTESVDCLLLSNNNLREVNLTCCWCIRKADCDRFRKFIKKENLNVNIIWI